MRDASKEIVELCTKNYKKYIFNSGESVQLFSKICVRDKVCTSYV